MWLLDAILWSWMVDMVCRQGCLSTMDAADDVEAAQPLLARCHRGTRGPHEHANYGTFVLKEPERIRACKGLLVLSRSLRIGTRLIRWLAQHSVSWFRRAPVAKRGEPAQTMRGDCQALAFFLSSWSLFVCVCVCVCVRDSRPLS